MKAPLSDKLSGRFEAAGRDISLVVENCGESDNTALTTVKVLTLDLDALTESVEGVGGFPTCLSRRTARGRYGS